MFQVIKTCGAARRGVFTCAHGRVETPVFMNVGTQGAIKGAVSAEDLEQLGCQVEPRNIPARQGGGDHRPPDARGVLHDLAGDG